MTQHHADGTTEAAAGATSEEQQQPSSSQAIGGVRGSHQDPTRLPSLAQVIAAGGDPYSANFSRLDLSANTPAYPPGLPQVSNGLIPPGASTAALHPGLRRLLLLQTLAARQQAALQLELHGQHHSLPPSSSQPPPSSSDPYSVRTPPGPPAPPPTPTESPHGLSASSPSPLVPTNTPKLDMPWNPALEGLNNVSPSNSTPESGSDGLGLGRGAVSGLGHHSALSAPDDIVTQQELEWWRHLTFAGGSATADGGPPGLPPPHSVPPFPLPGTSHPLFHSPPGAPSTHLHDSIDWSTFYPMVQVGSHAPSHLPLGAHAPHIPPHFASPHLHSAPPHASHSQILPSGVPMSREQSEPPELPENSPPTRGRKGAGSKGKAKASTTENEGSDENIHSGEGSMDPEEVEEDKRRRNTAASARFRAKKKQRDAELQQTSVQLRDRVTDLERQSQSLRSENKYLRDLISEKAEMDPRLLDVLRAHAASQALMGTGPVPGSSGVGGR